MQDMTHDDEMQDVDMIKTVLQKVIDEMNELEAGRIHPVAKVEVTKVADGGAVGVPHPNENKAESPDEAEPENTPEEPEENELDPGVLTQLMEKANSVDEDGASEEDHLTEIHPALADIIRKKKGLK